MKPSELMREWQFFRKKPKESLVIFAILLMVTLTVWITNECLNGPCFSACQSPVYNMRTGHQCGISAYKSSSSEHCGILHYVAKTSPHCGVAQYNSGTGVQCGVDLYYSCETGACGWNSVLLIEKFDAKECRHPNCGVQRYKTCRHADFGVNSYNHCEHEAHGKVYQTCQHEMHGVESYFECRHPDFVLEGCADPTLWQLLLSYLFRSENRTDGEQSVRIWKRIF